VKELGFDFVEWMSTATADDLKMFAEGKVLVEESP
jgi:hypothetical protein